MRRPALASILAFALGAGLIGAFGAGHASAQPNTATQTTPRYSLSATRLVIPYGGMSAVLDVQNLDLQPERFEIHTYAWSEDGTTKKVETFDVPLVFPRRFPIPIGQTVPVRLGVTDSTPDTEVAYRVLVQNLPGKIPDNGGMFHFITSYDVPMFIEPKNPHAHTVLTGVKGHYKQVTLSASNDGNVHSVIRHVSFTLNGKTQDQAVLAYVLAKSHFDMNVTFDGCGSGMLRITPDMESGVLPAEFPVSIPCNAPHKAR